MTVKMLSGTVLALVLSVSAAEAQKLSQIGGPANPPPASFKGQQFIDSRGCLFLRAGFGGAVNWVARVDRNHKPICGMAPTGGSAAQAAVAADMAPDLQASPAPQVAANPPTAVQPAAPAQPAPQQPAQAAAAPTPSYQGTSVATSVAGVGCYPDAPKLERVQISGGTALVCTRGDGTASGWRPPSYASQAEAQVAAQTAPLMAAPVVAAPVRVTAAPVQVVQVQVAMPRPVAQPVAQPLALQPVAAPPAARALPNPPKGWVYAWKDDRLNPLRGVGTAQGQAEQDMLWRRTVPMVLVTEKAPPKRWMKRHQVAQPMLAPPQPPALRTNLSTMSAPQSQTAPAPQAAGGRLAQIGTFGDPANAQGVLARLNALGLPAAVTRSTRNGKTLQTIYAGPFASSAEANAGLTRLHAAGFADAYLR